jgi:hypothetical protein
VSARRGLDNAIRGARLALGKCAVRSRTVSLFTVQLVRTGWRTPIPKVVAEHLQIGALRGAPRRIEGNAQGPSKTCVVCLAFREFVVRYRTKQAELALLEVVFGGSS